MPGAKVKSTPGHLIGAEKRSQSQQGDGDAAKKAKQAGTEPVTLVTALAALQIPALRSVLSHVERGHPLPATIHGLSATLRGQYNLLAANEAAAVWQAVSAVCFPEIKVLPPDLDGSAGKSWAAHLARTLRWLETLELTIDSNGETDVLRPFQGGVAGAGSAAGNDFSCAALRLVEETDGVKQLYIDDFDENPVVSVNFAGVSWTSTDDSIPRAAWLPSFTQAVNASFGENTNMMLEYQKFRQFRGYPAPPLEVDGEGIGTTDPLPNWITFRVRYEYTSDEEPADADGKGGGVTELVDAFVDVNFDWGAFDDDLMRAIAAAKAPVTEVAAQLTSRACHACKSAAIMYQCGGECGGSARYCSSQCQRTAWPSHQRKCRNPGQKKT